MSLFRAILATDTVILGVILSVCFVPQVAPLVIALVIALAIVALLRGLYALMSQGYQDDVAAGIRKSRRP